MRKEDKRVFRTIYKEYPLVYKVLWTDNHVYPFVLDGIVGRRFKLNELIEVDKNQLKLVF